MKRQVKLTSHGEIFLRRAVKILEEVDAAKREASDAKELLRGTLAVGVLPTIAPYLLPGVMAEFVEKFPGVEVIVQEDTTARLLKQVLSCEVDFALASPPFPGSQLHVQDLFSEELLVALPAGHPLAKKRGIRIEDLQNERLIVMKEGHCLGDQVLSFCERSDLRAPISFRSAQLETIQSLVRAGLGISLIPAMAVHRDHSGSPEYRSLQNPRPTRKIAAIWPRQRPPSRATKEFLKLISRQFGKSTLPHETGGTRERSHRSS